MIQDNPNIINFESMPKRRISDLTEISPEDKLVVDGIGFAKRSARTSTPLSELKFRDADTVADEAKLMKIAREELIRLADTSLKKKNELGPKEETEGKTERKLSPDQQSELIKTVKEQFEANMDRHKDMKWTDVQKKLEDSPEKMWSLSQMEETRGEPDVVDYDEETGEYIFFDCSKESPKGRRNIVYDKGAQDRVKELSWVEKCNGNAVDMAYRMGIQILDEEQYRYLQKIGKFDCNSWSWLKTPGDIKRAFGPFRGELRDHGVEVSSYDPLAPDDYGSFRGALRV